MRGNFRSVVSNALRLEGYRERLFLLAYTMTRITRSTAWHNLPIKALGLFLLVLCAAVSIQKISWIAGIAAGLFGTIALGLAISSLVILRQGKQSNAFRQKYPNEPWMWDARWQSDHIPSRSKWELGASVFATVVVSLLAIPMVLKIPEELFDGNLFVLLGFVPIVVAVYLGQYSYNSWHSERFEKSISLFLETRPGLIGAELSARLVMPSALVIDEIKATIEHRKIVTTRDSDGSSFEKKVDFQAAARIESSHDVEGQRVVRIAADVPKGCPATSWGPEKSESYWDLLIEIRLEEREVSVRYEVPVANPEQQPILS